MVMIRRPPSHVACHVTTGLPGHLTFCVVKCWSACDNTADLGTRQVRVPGQSNCLAKLGTPSGTRSVTEPTRTMQGEWKLRLDVHQALGIFGEWIDKQCRIENCVGTADSCNVMQSTRLVERRGGLWADRHGSQHAVSQSRMLPLCSPGPAIYDD